MRTKSSNKGFKYENDSSPPKEDARKKLHSSRSLFAECDDFKADPQEHFYAWFLDSQGHIIERRLIGKGGSTSVEASARDIFRGALETKAFAVACVHNHPDGDPTPSDADLKNGFAIRAVGDVLQVPVVDNLVVSKDGYKSVHTELQNRELPAMFKQLQDALGGKLPAGLGLPGLELAGIRIEGPDGKVIDLGQPMPPAGPKGPAN